MSDIFNHECDAWDSYEQWQDYGCEQFVRKSNDDFTPNPFFYYTRMYNLEITGQTEKAYRVILDGSDEDPTIGYHFWIPKGVTKFKGEITYVHTEFWGRKLEEIGYYE